MKQNVEKLRNIVCDLSAQPHFIHHKWYVTHHLNIVADMAAELCAHYPDADIDIVMTLVWLHDIGKMLDKTKFPQGDEHTLALTEGRKILKTCGYENEIIDRVIDLFTIYESAHECDFTQEDIHVQIVSTADACAHFVGPFFTLYWYENPHLDIDHLIDAGIDKGMFDFNRKITLAEGKAFCQSRIAALRENHPQNRPEKYF